MESKKLYLITYDIGDDPYDYTTVNACVCATREYAEKKIKELSVPFKNPFNEEREDLYKKIEAEWDNWVFESNRYLKGYTQQEVLEAEYKYFGKYGFTEDEIDSYNQYVTEQQLHICNWQIEEIDFWDE